MNPTSALASAFALLAGLTFAAGADARPSNQPKTDSALYNADHEVQVAEPERLEPKPAEIAQHPQCLADPYGFAGILNYFRALSGLHGLVYDPNLSSWAIHNNAVQNVRGMGHHILPNCYQNCGWNSPDAYSAAVMWMNSPHHRDNMLHPNVTRFGIAYGPGPYWTMNAL
jgi:Cysteine-rich secretory protein family